MVLKLQTRIGLLFATALVTLTLVLASTLSAFVVARQDYATITEIQAPSVEASRKMREQVDRIFADQLIYLLNPDERADLADRVAQDWAEFDRWYELTRDHADTPEEQRLMARIDAHRDAMLAVDQQVREAIQAGQLPEGHRLHRLEAPPHLDAMRRDTEAVHELNRAQVAALIRSSYDRFEQARNLSIAIALLGLAVAAVLWWLTARDIVAPLRALRDAAASLASGRFVTVHHDAAVRTQELLALERDFNRMSGRLKAAAEALYATNANLEAQVAERTLELSTANHELQRLVAELQTLDKLKSDFMAVMSHELLTPINFIVGFGSALEDELLGPLNESQKAAIGKMLAGAERLTRMVRNTLEYTQLEAGKLAFNPAAFDYMALVHEAVEAMTPAAEAKHQTLEIEAPEAMPPVHADPDRARQALNELLDNAIKFSPDDRPIVVRVAIDGPMAVTEVVDRGIGIAEEAMPNLFKPFYQADSGRTREHGGMGMGLAIGHYLIQQMGGQMTVISQPGVGTTVRFSLPLAVRGEAPGDQEASHQA